MTGRFVSRAGDKLDAALTAFAFDVSGLVCADFGCNVGGFTDCLLQRGAAKVYAIDTGYGQLAWTLRKDQRVVVMERTNAMYCPVPEAVDLVTIDVAWTVQEKIVPAALAWLKPGGQGQSPGQIISLLKPHYEMAKMSGRKPLSCLSDQQAQELCQEVCLRLRQATGCEVRSVCAPPIRGKGGNMEFLLLLAPQRTGA